MSSGRKSIIIAGSIILLLAAITFIARARYVYLYSFMPINLGISLQEGYNASHSFRVKIGVPHDVYVLCEPKMESGEELCKKLHDETEILCNILENGRSKGYPCEISACFLGSKVQRKLGGFDAERQSAYELQISVGHSPKGLNRTDPHIVVVPASGKEEGIIADFLLLIVFVFGLLGAALLAGGIISEWLAWRRSKKLSGDSNA